MRAVRIFFRATVASFTPRGLKVFAYRLTVIPNRPA
jgi:hypothetical protein